MMSGTFQTWIDNTSPGYFVTRDASNHKIAIQLTEEHDSAGNSRQFYAVTRPYDQSTQRYVQPDEIVHAGIVSWETTGTVYDG